MAQYGMERVFPWRAQRATHGTERIVSALIEAGSRGSTPLGKTAAQARERRARELGHLEGFALRADGGGRHWAAIALALLDVAIRHRWRRGRVCTEQRHVPRGTCRG
jgi:hypothetical protein